MMAFQRQNNPLKKILVLLLGIVVCIFSCEYGLDPGLECYNFFVFSSIKFRLKKIFLFKRVIKVGTIRLLQVTLTSFIVVIMLLSIITKEELYPFAPYTMYSYPMKASQLKVFEIYFVMIDGKEIVLEQKYVEPMDEARIKFSFEQMYWKNYGKFNTKDIDIKLKSLLELGKKEIPEAEAIRLKIFSYNDIDALRKKKPTIDFSHEYPNEN